MPDAKLDAIARACRVQIIRMLTHAGSGHPGGSLSVGMALGLKLAGSPGRVYCLMGDGEIQEGQVWEAAMSGPKLGQPTHPLDNLTAIVDYNRIQLDDFTAKILDLEPLVAKWQAFGWPVQEIDGHDLAQIGKALDQAEATPGVPSLIVAHTVKGKGVSFMENNPEWHGKAPKPEEAITAIREILGVSEAAWADYLKTDATTRALVDELRALEKK